MDNLAYEQTIEDIEQQEKIYGEYLIMIREIAANDGNDTPTSYRIAHAHLQDPTGQAGPNRQD